MPNIIIPGAAIKTKEDARKCLRDHDATITSDGWEEHEQKIEEEDRKCDKAILSAARDRVYGKYFGVQWPDGLYEKIFPKGKKNG